MQVAILIGGGAGTLLAALHGELWVALITALATALTTSLASRQLDETLVRYNQAATRRWKAATGGAQQSYRSVGREKTLSLWSSSIPLKHGFSLPVSLNAKKPAALPMGSNR